MMLVSSCEFPMKLLMFIVAATMALASQDGFEANGECLSKEGYKNISHSITEDALLEMKKQFSDLKGTMKEELERMKKQQDRLESLITNMSLHCSDRPTIGPSLSTGMPITENVIRHEDSHLTYKSRSSPISYEPPTKEDINLQKEFYNAASVGEVSFIKSVTSGLNLNWGNTDYHNWTALHIATRKNNPSIAATLLDAGANPNVQSDGGWTPVFIAAKDNLVTVLHVLLSRKYKADVNLQDNDGHSPLYIAAQEGHTGALELLLAKGADVNLADKYGQTPVYIAVAWGHTAALELLLAQGADVNLADRYGQTPIDIAAEYDQIGALEMLLAHGGDPNKVDNDGASPLGTASWKGNVEAVRTLINAGAQVTYVRPNDGSTALHAAAWYNHADVAQLLLESGAKKNKLNKYSRSPAEVSREYGDGSVARLIDNY